MANDLTIEKRTILSNDLTIEKRTILSAETIRLDTYLAQEFKDYSRSFFKTLILDERVYVNGNIAKANHKLREGDEVEVRFKKPQEIDLTPVNIPFDIVYEDEYLAVINKPKGLVVHPAAGNYTNTLVNALLYKIKDLSGINGEIRPGIVHRLDKDTSGLMLIAKNDFAHKSLADQIKNKTASRKYLAIVHGNIKEDEFTVDKPIGRSRSDRKKMGIVSNGRNAVTHFKVLNRFINYTLVEAQLETGRTHQIRVHLKSIGHPAAGDKVYGPKSVALTKTGQLLHAYQITFLHPKTNEKMTFTAKPEKEFEKVLNDLRKSNK
ncbi:MAG: RluA family pseudouridine synthase [Eubacteriales bacterium]